MMVTKARTWVSYSGCDGVQQAILMASFACHHASMKMIWWMVMMCGTQRGFKQHQCEIRLKHWEGIHLSWTETQRSDCQQHCQPWSNQLLSTHHKYWWWWLRLLELDRICITNTQHHRHMHTRNAHTSGHMHIGTITNSGNFSFMAKHGYSRSVMYH